MVKPSMYIKKKEPINEIGMVATGMMVVRQSRKKIKMMESTRQNAMMMVSPTSAMDARMYFVES